MRKLVIALAAMAALAGCTSTERAAGTGAVIGAATGALVSGDVGGAVVGGVVGAAAGVVVERVANSSRDCVYRDRYGRRYVDRCPQGY
jgi:hypothetical protein